MSVGPQVRGILTIDRSAPCDIRWLVGPGCSLWMGDSTGGGMHGDDPQDPRAALLTSIEISRFGFSDALLGDWMVGSAEAKLDLLLQKSDQCILPDAQIAGALFAESGHRTLEYLWRQSGKINLDFPRVPIRTSRGHRVIPYFSRESGEWRVNYRSFGGPCDNNHPSLVISPE